MTDGEAKISAAPPAGERLPRKERHDLRSFLGQVLGYSDLLLDEPEERTLGEVRADLERIHKAGANLLDLINRFVDPIAARADNSIQPVQEADAALATSYEQIAQETESTGSEKKPSLLIIDDSEPNRRLLMRALGQRVYHIQMAGSGQQALEILQTAWPDVILLDVLMPTLDGYEVLRRLKADPNTKHIPVVMISALDEIDSVVRCIEMGAEDYFLKPFDPVLLRARVGACLEKKRLRDHEQQITHQLQENYQRLKELEKQRDDLNHMIVHDLRTPLTSVLTGLQTLDAAGSLEAEQRECLDIAIGGGEILLGMINELLDISKMEQGALTLEITDIEPGTLVDRALFQVHALAEQKKHTVQRDVDPRAGAFRGDEQKILRALVNLLGNAIKFTPVQGSITLSLHPSESGEELIFTVRDTGEGIPENAFARIFEKFGQVETRKAGRRNSTGLGLTFCKLVTEAHKGRIWVESELGVGSAFHIALPREAASSKSTVSC